MYDRALWRVRSFLAFFYLGALGDWLVYRLLRARPPL
jgi:hypothetical protein